MVTIYFTRTISLLAAVEVKILPESFVVNNDV